MRFSHDRTRFFSTISLLDSSIRKEAEQRLEDFSLPHLMDCFCFSASTLE